MRYLRVHLPSRSRETSVGKEKEESNIEREGRWGGSNEKKKAEPLEDRSCDAPQIE